MFTTDLSYRCRPDVDPRTNKLEILRELVGSLQTWPYVVEHVGNRSDIYAGSPAFAPFAPPPATPHAAPPPAAVPLPLAPPPAAPAAPPASAGGFCYGSWTGKVYYEAKGSRFRGLCTFSVVFRGPATAGDLGPGGITLGACV